MEGKDEVIRSGGAHDLAREAHKREGKDGRSLSREQKSILGLHIVRRECREASTPRAKSTSEGRAPCPMLDSGYMVLYEAYLTTWIDDELLKSEWEQ